MPRQPRRFTHNTIQALQPKDKPYLESDVDRVYVRVLPSGRKSLMTVYSFEGKQRWITVGRFPEFSLKRAREEIRSIHEKVANGIDPIQEKRAAKIKRITTPTVARLAEDYLRIWAYPKKKSAREDERILNKDVLPVIGKRKVIDVQKSEIINLLDEVALRGKVISSQTLAVIRKMFNFGISRGVLENNPCNGIIPSGKPAQRDRVLSDSEIKALWKLMDEMLTDQSCRALKLILVTGQRPGEAASMEWQEIDGQWWTIPAEKTKNGKEHRVFLNELAQQVIGEPKSKGFVFPSRNGPHQSISPNALGHALRSKMDKFIDREPCIKYFSAHDLRRTAGTLIARLGHGTVVGKILNHTDRSVTGIYDRYSYDREKQVALEALAKKLNSLIQENSVSNLIKFPR